VQGGGSREKAGLAERRGCNNEGTGPEKQQKGERRRKDSSRADEGSAKLGNREAEMSATDKGEGGTGIVRPLNPGAKKGTTTSKKKRSQSTLLPGGPTLSERCK